MLNHVVLEGRIGTDLELRVGTNSRPFVKFNLAVVERNVKGEDGKWPVDWIPCIAGGGNGEFINNWFHKGDPIIVEGSLVVKDVQEGDKKFKYISVSISQCHFVLAPKTQQEAPAAKPEYQETFEVMEDTSDLPF